MLSSIRIPGCHGGLLLTPGTADLKKALSAGDIVAETTQPYPSAIRATTGPLTAGIFIGLPQSPIDGLVLENVTVHEANPVDNPYRMVGWNCAQPRSIGHCTQRADTCFCFLNWRCS